MDNLWIIYGYGWWLRKNPSEKYEFVRMIFQIYGKIKNGPNHRPDWIDFTQIPILCSPSFLAEAWSTCREAAESFQSIQTQSDCWEWKIIPSTSRWLFVWMSGHVIRWPAGVWILFVRSCNVCFAVCLGLGLGFPLVPMFASSNFKPPPHSYSSSSPYLCFSSSCFATIAGLNRANDSLTRAWCCTCLLLFIPDGFVSLVCCVCHWFAASLHLSHTWTRITFLHMAFSQNHSLCTHVLA